MYDGEVHKGKPHGKGKIYDHEGRLIYTGILKDGFPSLGVYYNLPKIFFGYFMIGNRNSYRFNFKKLDLLVKSIKYREMMMNFVCRGEVYNHSRSVYKIIGIVDSRNSDLTGIYNITNLDGSLFKGKLVDSKRTGYGIFVTEKRLIMIGYWREENFKGRVILPKGCEAKFGEGETNTVVSPENNSKSNFEDVQRVISFNQRPKELRGNFLIKNNSVIFKKVGIIIFEDGSKYQGMLQKNKMHGYGTLSFSSGDVYKGMWRNGNMDGLGHFIGSSVEYEGQFDKGLWNGFGILKLQTGTEVKGYWNDGKLIHGLIDNIKDPKPQNGIFIKDKITYTAKKEPDFFTNQKNFKIYGVTEIKFRNLDSRLIEPLPSKESQILYFEGKEEEEPEKKLKYGLSQNSLYTDYNISVREENNNSNSLKVKSLEEPILSFIGEFKRLTRGNFILNFQILEGLKKVRIPLLGFCLEEKKLSSRELLILILLNFWELNGIGIEKSNGVDILIII